MVDRGGHLWSPLSDVEHVVHAVAMISGRKKRWMEMGDGTHSHVERNYCIQFFGGVRSVLTVDRSPSRVGLLDRQATIRFRPASCACRSAPTAARCPEDPGRRPRVHQAGTPPSLRT